MSSEWTTAFRSYTDCSMIPTQLGQTWPTDEHSAGTLRATVEEMKLVIFRRIWERTNRLKIEDNR